MKKILPRISVLFLILFLASCTFMTKGEPLNVVFYSDGEVYYETTVRAGKTATPAAAPEAIPSGKVAFLFWSLESDSSTATAFDFSTPINNETTFYAIWADCTVTYKNGDEVVHTDYVVKGKPTKAPDITLKVPEGKEFSHWSLYENGNEYSFESPVTSSITLHAVYTEKTFTVRFVDGVSDTERTVAYGARVFQPANPTVTGRVFRWWSATQNGPAFDFSTAITSDLTLYAVWDVLTYAVVFDDGTTETTQVVVAGERVKAPADPTGEGRTFLHWSRTQNGSAYDFSTPVNGALTLYAVWEYDEYTVEFYSDGILFRTETVKYGDIIPKPTTDPTMTGKTFAYWAAAEGSSTAFDFGTTAKGNMKLYAVFKDIVYTVTFNNNGVLDSVKVTWGELLNRPSDPYAAQGKRFMHWSRQQGGLTAYDFTEPVTTSFTLYAVYEDLTFEVRFHDGDAVTVSTVVYGNTVEAVTSENPEGKRFLHWSASEGGSAFDFDTPVFSNLDLYAVYEDVRFSVTYINGDSKETESVIYGDKAPDKDVTVPADSVFRYWSESPNGNPFDFSKGIYKDTTLYAVIEPRMVTVVFDYGSSQKTTEIQYGKTITKPADPSDTDEARFLYWSSQPNGVEYDFSTKVTGDITLYAVWDAIAYTVTFISNGEVVSTVNVNAGDRVSAPSVSGSSEDELLGWVDENDNAFDFKDRIYSDRTLKAMWSSEVLVIDGSTLKSVKYTAIKELKIPESITSIGSGAFKGCDQLASVEIPTSVNSIGAEAFSGCSSLSSIVIPKGVTAISDYMFADCSSLSKVVLPDGLTSIGNYAFDECKRLSSINFPSSLKTIGDRAFEHCTSLKIVDLPNGITELGEYIFYEGGIESFEMPGNWTTLPRGIFTGCLNFTSIQFNSIITTICYQALCDTGLRELVIPETVECLENNSLSFNDNLTTIKLPDKLTSMGSLVCYYDHALEEITIPAGITYIYKDSFTHCENLEFAYIMNPSTVIENGAFNTSVTELIWPNGQDNQG